jgi:hypothetical protein
MISRSLIAPLLCLSLGAALPAGAQSIDGVGRMAALGGYWVTPNDYFYGRATTAGFPPVTRSPGGPSGQLSFGYGAAAMVEVAVDAFAGTQAFELGGLSPFRATSYGGFVGVRLTQNNVIFRGFMPYVGLQSGVLISDVTSSSLQQFERLINAYSANVGFTVRAGDHLGFTLDARYIYARAYVEGISGINVGGFWLAAGVTWFFSPTAKQELSDPGF